MRKTIYLAVAATMILLATLPAAAGGNKKQKAPEYFCALRFLVLRDSSGKPIKNASVIVHSLRKDGSQDNNDGFQLKTDNEGRTHIDDIPYGRLRLQVIAHGLQTFGEDIEVNQPEQEFVVRLKPPADQVSIY